MVIAEPEKPAFGVRQERQAELRPLMESKLYCAACN